MRGVLCPLLLLTASTAVAQVKAFTWAEIKDRFEAGNPNLKAGQLNTEESKAQEITAYLRPNPDLTIATDQFQLFNSNPYRPLATAIQAAQVSYLHERQHKRELRRDSARKATGIAESQQADLERTLLFDLRQAFVQLLQAKSVLGVAKENLAYYDRLLTVSADRFKAGDIAQVDLDRLQLQRIQYESDAQNATINVRTAKIQLLTLLNDRTPVEQFDADGPFDFSDRILPLSEIRQAALETRPDLRAAMQAIDKSKTDHQLAIANGTADPTWFADFGHQTPGYPYLGFGLTIPLRVFDRNQGEKLRTDLEINRSERLRQASEAQVFNDVDSAYATLTNNMTLLQRYKRQYLQQAIKVRETIAFAYGRGGASLLDFLNAQNDYRSTQLNYLNLIGSYLTAASQLNMAVGREVIQ